ncbi:MAG: MaoC family dehydratase [Desulfobacterales bacterium]|nr:MaoC family dehydratase [Desulfobacterales bacterium]
MIGKTIEELQVGLTERFSKTISESDIYLFAGISGDFNPAHINEEYAKQTFFKTRIAHGMLTASFISTLIGTKLPGPGTIYMRQELNFLAPVVAGDTITAMVEVINIDTDKKRIWLKTSCTNQDGTVVLDGQAIVSPPRKK